MAPNPKTTASTRRLTTTTTSSQRLGAGATQRVAPRGATRCVSATSFNIQCRTVPGQVTPIAVATCVPALHGRESRCERRSSPTGTRSAVTADVVPRLLRLLPLVAIPLATLTGCGSDGDGTGGEGGEGEDNQADHDALAACGTPTCAELFARKVEGGEAHAFEEWSCVLDALRDRTPGAYDVRMEHAHSSGTSLRTVRLVVTTSGQVETAEVQGEEGAPEPETLLPAQRCTLRDAAFFEQCKAYIDSVDPHPVGDGTYPNEVEECFFAAVGQLVPWYVDCQPQPPTCE